MIRRHQKKLLSLKNKNKLYSKKKDNNIKSKVSKISIFTQRKQKKYNSKVKSTNQKILSKKNIKKRFQKKWLKTGGKSVEREMETVVISKEDLKKIIRKNFGIDDDRSDEIIDSRPDDDDDDSDDNNVKILSNDNDVEIQFENGNPIKLSTVINRILEKNPSLMENLKPGKQVRISELAVIQIIQSSNDPNNNNDEEKKESKSITYNIVYNILLQKYKEDKKDKDEEGKDKEEDEDEDEDEDEGEE